MEQGNVQSIERAISIIEVLSNSPEGLQLITISEAVGLHKSTVHRILSSLLSLGYVKKSGSTGIYKLSLKLFEVSSRIVNGLDIYSAAKPHLDELSRLTGEAVHLVVRDEYEIIYIYKVDFSSGGVRMSSRIGLRAPMYCTAVGKCILAHLPEPELCDIWDRSNIIALTENTIVTMEALKKELADIRKSGHAFDNEENERGVRCIGAPVFDYSGSIAGAFSVSIPTVRVNDQKIAEFLPYIHGTMEKISRDMGYHPV